MSYLMFMVAEALGGLYLYFTYKGIFGLSSAFIVVILMLALSFHVLVRKPDGTSIRMACFTMAVWMLTIFSVKLALEFRSWQITLLASLFALIVAITACFSTVALIQRPTELDVED